MQECMVKAEVSFIIQVPDGKPHRDYAKEAAEDYFHNAFIYLDGKDEDPVQVDVDWVEIGQVEE